MRNIPKKNPSDAWMREQEYEAQIRHLKERIRRKNEKIKRLLQDLGRR